MSSHPVRHVDQVRADNIRWAFTMARANRLVMSAVDDWLFEISISV
jgi:hypothetical protein